MFKIPISYTTALYATTAVLVSKQLLLKLLLIRTRVGNDLFTWPEDQPGLQVFLSPLKLLLFGGNRDDAKEVLER